jgi:hypothetical protein
MEASLSHHGIDVAIEDTPRCGHRDRRHEGSLKASGDPGAFGQSAGKGASVSTSCVSSSRNGTNRRPDLATNNSHLFSMRKSAPLWTCDVCGQVLPNQPKTVLQHVIAHAEQRPFARSQPDQQTVGGETDDAVDPAPHTFGDLEPAGLELAQRLWSTFRPGSSPPLRLTFSLLACLARRRVPSDGRPIAPHCWQR